LKRGAAYRGGFYLKLSLTLKGFNPRIRNSKLNNDREMSKESDVINKRNFILQQLNRISLGDRFQKFFNNRLISPEEKTKVIEFFYERLIKISQEAQEKMKKEFESIMDLFKDYLID
jgi:hypothetical protein